MYISEELTLTTIVRNLNALNLYHYEWRESHDRIIIRVRISRDGKVVQLVYCDTFTEALDFLCYEYHSFYDLTHH